MDRLAELQALRLGMGVFRSTYTTAEQSAKSFDLAKLNMELQNQAVAITLHTHYDREFYTDCVHFVWLFALLYFVDNPLFCQIVGYIQGRYLNSSEKPG